MMDSTSDGEFINASDLAQFYYCKRKIYFLKVAGVHPVTRWKMKAGKDEQEREYKRVLERKDFFGLNSEDIAEALPRKYLSSHVLKLRGIIDVLLLLKTGEAVPVEIKYSDDTSLSLARKKQLFAYMLLVEEALRLKCPYGIIYFPEQNISVKVFPSECDKLSVRKDLFTIWEMFKTERIPRRAPEWKCNYCEVKRYCWT